MKRHRIALFRVVAAALGLAVGTVSAADVSAGVRIQVGSGFPGHSSGPHSRRAPRNSHGVPFIERRDPGFRHNPRPRHLHPHHRRGHRHLQRHHRRGHRHRGRHVQGSGCTPATQRSWDRHGHVIIHAVTICYDHFGRPYVLGGPPGRY